MENKITFSYEWEGKTLVKFLNSLGIKAWISTRKDRLGNYALYYQSSNQTARKQE